VAGFVQRDGSAEPGRSDSFLEISKLRFLMGWDVLRYGPHDDAQLRCWTRLKQKARGLYISDTSSLSVMGRTLGGLGCDRGRMEYKRGKEFIPLKGAG
jgi:hypothetical protein